MAAPIIPALIAGAAAPVASQVIDTLGRGLDFASLLRGDSANENDSSNSSTTNAFVPINQSGPSLAQYQKRLEEVVQLLQSRIAQVARLDGGGEVELKSDGSGNLTVDGTSEQRVRIESSLANDPELHTAFAELFSILTSIPPAGLVLSPSNLSIDSIGDFASVGRGGPTADLHDFTVVVESGRLTARLDS